LTSVLQTTAGKMIFGRFDERTHAVHEKERGERPAREHAPTAAARVRHRAGRLAALQSYFAYESLRHPAGRPVSARVWAAKRPDQPKQFMLLEGAPILIHTNPKIPSIAFGHGNRGRVAAGGSGLGTPAWFTRSTRIRNIPPSRCVSSKAATAGRNPWRMRWRLWRTIRNWWRYTTRWRPFIDGDLVEKVIAEAAQPGPRSSELCRVTRLKRRPQK